MLNFGNNWERIAFVYGWDTVTRVAVFCGASSGFDQKFVNEIKRMSRWIVEKKYTLVYGGGGVGLMGELASGVLEDNGEVIGVMPEMLVARNAALPGLSSLEVVADMDERKRRMMDLSDLAIAFPGGPGTLEEIAQAFSWSRLGMNDKPCIFFDLDGFWQPVALMYDRMVDEGFLTVEDRSKLLFTQSFDEIDEWCKAFVPPAVRQYKQ